MKSTRTNYTKYYMLPAPINPWRTTGYEAHWWTFEEALDTAISGEYIGADVATEGLITSGQEAGANIYGEHTSTWAQDWQEEVSMADSLVEAGVGADGVWDGWSAHGEYVTREDDSTILGQRVYLEGDQYRGGKEEIFSRSSQGYLSDWWLHRFFPDLPGVAGSEGMYGAGQTSYIDGQNYITKMMNAGIYYAVPPKTNKGFLNNNIHFALASKSSFYKMSNTYATDNPERSGGVSGGTAQVIDPCPKCTTIGRANNGWHEMALYMRGGMIGLEGVSNYNPFDPTQGPGSGATDFWWETNARMLFGTLVAAGIWDSAAYDTMIDYLEMDENTYGTAAFQTFFIYENFYGIMTTYNPLLELDFSYDDMFSLSFYHPRAIMSSVGYSTNIVSVGGYPDATGTGVKETSAISATSQISVGDGSTYQWLLPMVGTRVNQAWVPSIPFICTADSANSELVATSLSGMSITDHGANLGSAVINYHNNKTALDVGEFVRGDKKRRFQMKNDTAAGNDRAMGSFTKARGFIANKAWLLQNMVPIWNGKLEKKIHQQLTRNLDIDLMHPVGDAPDSTSYTSSTFTPKTTTPGDSSY